MKPNLTAIYRNLRYRMILAGDYGASALFASGEEGVWYDPSDLTTMFQDAAGTTAAVVGQPVGKILDKSGNGNHATQSTDLSRPVLRQSGDKYYLEFDGVDDFLVTSAIDFSSTDKMSVFAGYVREGSTIGFIAELSIGNAAGSFWFAAPYSATQELGYALKGDGVGQPTYLADALPAAPTTEVSSIIFDIAGLAIADEIKPRVNTVTPSLTTLAVGPAGGGNFGNYPLYLGMRAGSSLPLNGNLYSLIVRGAPSTSEEIADAERYVNSKTGAYND